MLKDAFNWEKLSHFFQSIYYMLGINLWFMICNFPVLLFFLFVGISKVGTYLPLFLICLLPLAPSLCGAFYAMNRLLNKEDGGVVHDYFKGYKSGALLAIRLGACQLGLIFILWTNIRFFMNVVPMLPIFILSFLLFLLIVFITPNLYFLAGIYDMDFLQTVKAGVILTLGKPISTLGGIATIGIMLAIFEVMPGFAVLFMGSVFPLLITYMNRRFLKEKNTK